jgi:hypothetical protein
MEHTDKRTPDDKRARDRDSSATHGTDTTHTNDNAAIADLDRGGKKPDVRPAGPKTMRDPPKHWDEADEFSDESFPASDPPAKY